MQPIVLQLQADANDPAVSASVLLRKAKIVATKLDLPEFLSWIDMELNGYDNVSDLPLYRKLSGNPQYFNPYQGWQPILFPDAELQELISTAPLAQALGPIEQMLSKDGGRESYGASYHPDLKVKLIQELEVATDVQIQVTYGQVRGIVDAVQNIILDWSLELEKSGILGEGLTFSENEKREGAPVSHQFFAQNIGVVGNVTDHARVTNLQTTHVQQVDYDKLTELVGQIRAAVPLMPAEKRDAMVEQAEALDQELAKDDRDSSRIRRALASMRSVCEGAAGNVVAQGILALIRGI